MFNSHTKTLFYVHSIVGTQIRADMMYVYKEEDINFPSAFLEEVLKVSGMLLFLPFQFFYYGKL